MGGGRRNRPFAVRLGFSDFAQGAGAFSGNGIFVEFPYGLPYKALRFRCNLPTWR